MLSLDGVPCYYLWCYPLIFMPSCCPLVLSLHFYALMLSLDVVLRSYPMMLSLDVIHWCSSFVLSLTVSFGVIPWYHPLVLSLDVVHWCCPLLLSLNFFQASLDLVHSVIFSHPFSFPLDFPCSLIFPNCWFFSFLYFCHSLRLSLDTAFRYCPFGVALGVVPWCDSLVWSLGVVPWCCHWCFPLLLSSEVILWGNP